VHFDILSNPEFSAEGTATRDLLTPDRVLIGNIQTPKGAAAAEALKRIYAAWIPVKRIISTNLWSSELAKLVANAMLAQRVSTINSISAICERTGADIEEISHAIGLDSRIGNKFLKSGLGFGGPCFQKDILSLTYLADELDLPEVAEYWRQVIHINQYQMERFVKRAVSSLNDTLSGKKIAILGYAFKKGTSDIRNSLATEVIKQLLVDTPAEIAIFDPECHPEDIKNDLQQLSTHVGQDILKPNGPVEVYKMAYDACAGASACLILTEWDQFRYPSVETPNPASQEISSAYSRHLNSGYNLSELDILGLRTRMRRNFHEGTTTAPRIVAQDLLGGFVKQPSCAEDCQECTRGEVEQTLADENVDWERISETMKQPKWIFDGRGW
jgi:UDPglucose 6-dehydrogenase